MAVFTVLAAMLIANAEWIFTRPDWVDTWMYFGFFRHYDVSNYLAGNKKIARLPWILVGFAVNKLFPPIDAAVVLHAGCFALGAFYFYRLARQLFGRPAAVITTLAYITWVPGHGSGGWDYHNTLVPVFFFAAYRSLLWALNAGSRRLPRFFVFGVLFALALHTNIIVILLLPALVVRFVAASLTRERRDDTRKLLMEAAAGTAAGGVAITALLGLVNAAAGRDFFFWDILVSRSAFLVEHPAIEKSWWLPWSQPWWTSNINMPLINAVLLLAGAYLVYAATQDGWRRIFGSVSTCAMVEYLVTYGVFAFWQTLGHPLLQPFYMAMPLTMAMFLALAALVSDAVGAREASSFVILLAACAFGIQFVGRLSINPDLFFHWTPGTWTSDLPPILVIIIGFGAALFVKKIPRVAPAHSTSVACLCIAVALGQANTLWPIATDDRAPYDFRRASCRIHQTLLTAVAGADDILFPLRQAGHRIALWYQGDEFDGKAAPCRLATYQIGKPLYAMGYGAANVHYWDPETDIVMPGRMLDQIVSQHDILVLITNNRSYVAGVLARIHRRNQGWKLARTDFVGDREARFALQIITPPALTL